MVPQDATITGFIDQALAAGIPHDALVGMLRANGWAEKDIYSALAEHYRGVLGLAVPRRAGSGASAREAFFYLLIFSTLATWTIAFGVLSFALIDRWLADPLFPAYMQGFQTTQITWSVAALIVAFPLYLFLSRVVVREAAVNPEKLDSGVRKWLTYIALVIAASVFMGDLITSLDYLLRGEMTSRFLAKAFVVLLLSGGVFFYYFGALRRNEAGARLNNRDGLMGMASSALVSVMIIAGFLQLGPPSSQRLLRADNQRVRDLYIISSAISNHWRAQAAHLPSTLSELGLGSGTFDPLTHAAYEYRPEDRSKYELCATFAVPSDPHSTGPGAESWRHPAGHFCYELDATMPHPDPGQSMLIGQP